MIDDTAARTIELLQEVRWSHGDKDSPDYNECEKEGEECMWCGNAREVIAALETTPTQVEPKQATGAFAMALRAREKNMTVVAGAGEYASFKQHLKDCKAEVETWPQWKQDVMRGVLKATPAGEKSNDNL